jgi:CRISPR-associated endonuclease Cas1
MAKRALKNNLGLIDADRGEWQSRSEKWHQHTKKRRTFQYSKMRREQPLILTGHGVSLRVERNTLVIKNGFTHHPQEPEIIRFFPGELTLPPRIIFLDCSGSISFHVLAWLNAQGVDLVHLNWQGEIIATTSKAGYSANLEKMLWQREIRQDHEKRMQFCIELMTRKFGYSIATLQRMNFQHDAWQRAVEFLEISTEALFLDPPETIQQLLMIEAHCALAYFRAWSGVTLAWKGSNRKFIPDHWGGFDQRSSVNNLTGNSRANHPINAMLNYAYRVAESALLIQAISEGFEPTLGIMHEVKPNRNSFLHDLIELERADIDFQIFSFVRSNVFAADDFVITPEGVVRLNPQLARYIATVVCGIKRQSIEESLGLDFAIDAAR